MAEHQAFADLLNHYLRQDKRSARWLASEIEVHPSTVSRWTNGETIPEDPQTVQRITTAFKLSDRVEIEALITSAGFGFIIRESDGPSADADSVGGLSTVHDEHLLEGFNSILLRLVNAAPPALAAPLFERFR